MVMILEIVEAECIGILWVNFDGIEHALDVTLDCDSFFAGTEEYS
jgi:hypothetical protein